MKGLHVFARVLIAFSLLFSGIVQATKKSFRWPSFIVDNILYITLALIAIGYVLLFIHYSRAKDSKKTVELAVITAVVAVFFVAVNFIMK